MKIKPICVKLIKFENSWYYIHKPKIRVQQASHEQDKIRTVIL